MVAIAPAHERFLVERSVGAGGMGAVYRAIDRISGSPVALKVALDDGEEYRSRALAEAGALAALDHPAIVRLVASGIGTDGRPFLAMEWLDGEDLAARLLRGPLSLSDSMLIGVRLAEGLMAAHSVGIVHRDLKPSNIFLPAGAVGRAKLVDFGIARVGERRVTATGIVLGTPGYMAPEQAMGRSDVGAPVDIFALGAVLYECIIGECAFSGAHAVAVLAKVLFEEVPPLQARYEGIPSALSSLVAQMLRKEPAERPTAAAVVKQLSEMLPMFGATIHAGSPVNRANAIGVEHQTQSIELSLTDEQKLVCVLVARFPAANGQSVAPPSHDTPPGALPAGDMDALERLRIVVAPLGGRAERLLDGTLVASWTGKGTPRDLAARAARAALLARERLPGCALALGSGLAATDSHFRFGSALDRAAASLGRSGMAGVCIDDITAGLLDDRFDVQPSACGHQLVGRNSLDDGPTRRLAGRTSPCVGRERELRMLGDLLDECIDAPRASVAIVTAPPGIGKSRLCREMLRGVRLREDVEIWSTEADELGMGSPFALVGAALQCAIGVKSSDSLEERRQKLTSHVARHVAAKEQARVAAMLGEIVSAPFPTSAHALLAAARHDPSIMAEQVRRAFIDLLTAETEHHAVVLVFEDLHWADAPSIKLVMATLAALRDRPLMLLGFARPEASERFGELWSMREMQEIRLGGLTKRAATKIVQQALPDADATLVQRIVERADGNALYLEELVRAAAAGRGENLPETIAAMVQARFGELAAEERRVIRAASVFGGAFWFGSIASILGGGPNRATALRPSVFDSLVEQEILEHRSESSFPNDKEYVFRHALLREGAYALLTDADRAACHLRAAEWLEQQTIANDRTTPGTSSGLSGNAERREWNAHAKETGPERIAYHFELGGAAGRAVQWHSRAAARALQFGDPSGAVTSAERGLELLATMADAPSLRARELELRISHFQSLMLTRGYTIPEVESSLRRAQELCPPDAPERHSILHGLWTRHLAGGDPWTGRAFAAQLLALADADGSPSKRVLARHALGMTCVFLGEYDAARENLESAIELFDRDAHPEASLMMGADIEVFASCYLSMAYWSLGLADRGLSTLRHAMDLAEKLGHPFTRTVAASFAALQHQNRRERSLTLEYAERTRALATEFGFMHYLVQSDILRGWAAAGTGGSDAFDVMSKAITTRRQRGGLIAMPHFAGMLAEACLDLGQVGDALGALDDAVAIMNKTGERFYAPEIHRLRAEAFIARAAPGDLDRAEDELLRACEIAHYQNARTMELRAATSLARLWRTLGNGREGCQKVANVLARINEGFDTPDVQQARSFLEKECAR